MASIPFPLPFFLPSLFFFFPSPRSLSPFSSFFALPTLAPTLPCTPPFPLEVGPLKSSEGAWRSAVSSPSGVWGGDPAEIDFVHFSL